MAFSKELVAGILNAPPTQGSKLGRLALGLNFSVTRIAKLTGATRQTVYNWMWGGKVAPYYRTHVSDLIKILRSAASSDGAWKEACQHFNYRN